MSKEEADLWNRIKEAKQEKRWENDRKSREILEKAYQNDELDYFCKNEDTSHYVVTTVDDGAMQYDAVDFWATTGTFIRRKTKERGRGVFNLIKFIKKMEEENEN